MIAVTRKRDADLDSFVDRCRQFCANSESRSFKAVVSTAGRARRDMIEFSSCKTAKSDGHVCIELTLIWGHLV